MVLGLVADGHRLAGGEGLGLELLADPVDRFLGHAPRPGKDVRDDGGADVVVDESFDVSVVGIADGAVVVDHALGPVGRGVPELVLVEGVGPPLLELVEAAVPKAVGHLGIHQDDLAFDVDALVVVVAELGRRDAIADIDDLGRDFARPRGPAGNELILVLVGLLDDAALPGRNEHLTDAAGVDDSVGVREELAEGAVVAAGLDAPALEQGLDPLDAGFVLLGPRQPSAVLLGDKLRDVVVERLALDEVHGLEDLGIVGGRGRGLTARLGLQARGRESESEQDGRGETAGTCHDDSSFVDGVEEYSMFGPGLKSKRGRTPPPGFDSAPRFCYFDHFGVNSRRHP
jgi:hypothetical protein